MKSSHCYKLLVFALSLYSVSVEAATFGDIPASLSLSASQSVRRNSGNTIFEAYTPSAFDPSDAWVINENTLGALSVNTAKRLNYKSISADTTFTFSGAPTTGSWFSLQIHNTDGNFDKQLTIPSSFSVANNKIVTTATAFHRVTSGADTFLTWYYDGSTYFLFGDSSESNLAVGQYTTLVGYDAGSAATGADFSVFIGTQAGGSNPAPGQAVAIGYQAGFSPGGYSGTFVGFQAGSLGGGTSAVGLGYQTMSSADTSGTGNIAIGVHAAQSAVSLSGTVAIGYHALDTAATANNSVVMGDHAGTGSSMNADNCIFLGPFSGVSRNNTLWIDGGATSFGGIANPLIYGEFDNRVIRLDGKTTARLKPRVTTITSSATPTINTDNCDAVTITALAADITSMTSSLSGTPDNFDKLIIRFKDNGTARAITWGASFVDGQIALPTTTIISKTLDVGLIYDSVRSKWVCKAVDQQP